MKAYISSVVLAGLALLPVGCKTLCPNRPTTSTHPWSAGGIQTVTYDATKRAAFFLYVPDPTREEYLRTALKQETESLLTLQKEMARCRASSGNRAACVRLGRELDDAVRRINLLSVTMRPVVLAENPPDAGRSTSNLLAIAMSHSPTEVTGSVTATHVSQIVALGKLESRNYMLRDALYRLNEGLLLRPTLLSEEEYIKVFTEILDTVKAVNETDAENPQPRP